MVGRRHRGCPVHLQRSCSNLACHGGGQRRTWKLHAIEGLWGSWTCDELESPAQPTSCSPSHAYCKPLLANFWIRASHSSFDHVQLLELRFKSALLFVRRLLHKARETWILCCVRMREWWTLLSLNLYGCNKQGASEVQGANSCMLQYPSDSMVILMLRR
jgi:hypothetical protein